MQHIALDGLTLSIENFEHIVYSNDISVNITEEARQRVRKARNFVEKAVERGDVIYGVTTGFGEFANVAISTNDLELLQENLIVSHSVGTGDWLPREVVRGMMILRINALLRGHSGIREQTIDLLLALLNNNLTPAVPEQGSVGSSGDLIPLSHIALALIGKGRFLLENGTVVAAKEILQQYNLQPVRLQAKEGLALINGTQMMCSYGALLVAKARRLADLADIIGAISLDALRGTDRAFDERLQRVRGFSGQILSAKRIRTLLQGSEIRESHREGDGKVQDAYSLRCMPQVHGASRDAIEYVASVIATEMNAATDNPLLFPDDGDYLEGGNFHGQPLALALDFAAIACSELANISERRCERLVNGALSGLPRFLTPKGGLHSGMMIAQYSAAALVSENKVLSHPASVDSIPTSANQEDHNSMGSIAAHKLWRVVHNVERVLAIELLCAAQAIDFLRPLHSSTTIEAIMSEIRSVVPFNDHDRILYDDVAAILQLLQNDTLRRIANTYIDSQS